MPMREYGKEGEAHKSTVSVYTVPINIVIQARLSPALHGYRRAKGAVNGGVQECFLRRCRQNCSLWIRGSEPAPEGGGGAICRVRPCRPLSSRPPPHPRPAAEKGAYSTMLRASGAWTLCLCTGELLERFSPRAPPEKLLCSAAPLTQDCALKTELSLQLDTEYFSVRVQYFLGRDTK